MPTTEAATINADLLTFFTAAATVALETLPGPDPILRNPSVRCERGSVAHALLRAVLALVPTPLETVTATSSPPICLDPYMFREVYFGVESVFEIIAEPNRRAILSLLVSSQRSVGEIERHLRMPQPTVSKHLRVLRDAGFVESTVDAQRRL